MYEITIIDEVYGDVLGIHDYIKNRFLSISNADNVVARIYSAIDSLSEFPERCHLVTNLSYTIHQYRMIMAKNYMVVFYIDNKSVNIVAVMYKRRDFRTILNKELPRRDN